MEINKQLRYNKEELLDYFRNRANEILSDLALKFAPENFKEKAKEVNHAIIKSKDNLIDIVLKVSKNEKWSNQETLETILMITYTNDVVMLETRNDVWRYEYMSFSRRIGELWEPFCKLCFYYSDSVSLFIPPLFSEVKQNLTDEIVDYIDKLSISREKKVQLKKYYDKVWTLVTSGEIKLECDLHFVHDDTKYIVDFKSGFGSNEKGNTNRLLLVGSIYKNIETELFKCLIFVRSNDNNHYLSTLQNSGTWQTFCGDNTYSQIYQFAGFNIKNWIENNIDWISDFSQSMKETIETENLQNYLIW